MTYWLVTARPRTAKMAELRQRLDDRAFATLRPFGVALSDGLTGARIQSDGTAVWEEEDYCDPPLAQEREAVLDDYFTDIGVRAVKRGAGWRRIADLPPLFPSVLDRDG